MSQLSNLETELSMKLHLAFKIMTVLIEFKKQWKLRNGFGYSFLNVLTLSYILRSFSMIRLQAPL